MIPPQILRVLLPVTSPSPLCACTGQRKGCDALCPTDCGADETSLYRTYLAGQLLAGAVRATAGAGSSTEGRSRSPAGHDPRPHPASVRDEKRKSDVPQYGWCPSLRQSSEAGTT